MKSSKYNIAIIGAARRRQGTGPFIAKQLHQMGHHICGFVGSSSHTITPTRNHLCKWANIDCQGYTSISSLLEQQTVDIIAICSPIHSHSTHIDQALQHRCHLLIEKPWLWLDDESELRATADTYTLRAFETGILMYMIAQWPFTLPYFRKLYPQESLQSNQIKYFGMHLSPQSNGAQMVLDSVSHVLSMLYALLGFGDITNIHVSNLQSTVSTQLCVQFSYEHIYGKTEVSLNLTQAKDGIKYASYSINERSVSREVILPDYAMKLRAEDSRCVDLPDPMTLCLQDFLAQIKAGLKTDRELLLQHTIQSVQLMHAAKQHLD